MIDELERRIEAWQARQAEHGDAGARRAQSEEDPRIERLAFLVEERVRLHSSAQ